MATGYDSDVGTASESQGTATEAAGVERHPLLAALLALELPVGDYALFGSGPLLARGWIDEVGDLDVLARGAAWDKARRLGAMRRLEPYDVDVIFVGEDISIGTTWGLGEFSVDQLIDEAELIEGIPCVPLRHVVAYKRIADRPKDRAHIAVIEDRTS
jgi:hypothetical protein